MNNINGNNINVGYPSVQAPEVSFSLDQVKSLLHFKEAGENSRFATSAENTTGIFKLGSKGKLTNANRRRDFTCRLEDCTLDNLKIRQALYNVFKAEKGDNVAFLANARKTLGLNDEGEADVALRKEVRGGRVDGEGGDGTVSLCSMPLERRTVKQLIDQLEGRTNLGEIDTGAKRDLKFVSQEVVKKFANDLQSIICPQLQDDHVQFVKGRIDEYVEQFETDIKAGKKESSDSLKNFVGRIDKLRGIVSRIKHNSKIKHNEKDQEAQLFQAVLNFAAKFSLRKMMLDYVKNTLHWDVPEIVNKSSNAIIEKDSLAEQAGEPIGQNELVNDIRPDDDQENNIRPDDDQENNINNDNEPLVSGDRKDEIVNEMNGVREEERPVNGPQHSENDIDGAPDLDSKQKNAIEGFQKDLHKSFNTFMSGLNRASPLREACEYLDTRLVFYSADYETNCVYNGELNDKEKLESLSNNLKGKIENALTEFFAYKPEYQEGITDVCGIVTQALKRFVADIGWDVNVEALEIKAPKDEKINDHAEQGVAANDIDGAPDLDSKQKNAIKGFKKELHKSFNTFMSGLNWESPLRTACDYLDTRLVFYSADYETNCVYNGELNDKEKLESLSNNLKGKIENALTEFFAYKPEYQEGITDVCGIVTQALKRFVADIGWDVNVEALEIKAPKDEKINDHAEQGVAAEEVHGSKNDIVNKSSNATPDEEELEKTDRGSEALENQALKTKVVEAQQNSLISDFEKTRKCVTQIIDLCSEFKTVISNSKHKYNGLQDQLDEDIKGLETEFILLLQWIRDNDAQSEVQAQKLFKKIQTNVGRYGRCYQNYLTNEDKISWDVVVGRMVQVINTAFKTDFTVDSW